MATEEAEEGVEILYEGKEPVRADVVFVHGLTGHGSQTWQKGGVLWPRDLLPKALPNVRVIAWNYDVDVLRFFNKTKQNSILQHAENLLFDLGGERERRKADPSYSSAIPWEDSSLNKHSSPRARPNIPKTTILLVMSIS